MNHEPADLAPPLPGDRRALLAGIGGIAAGAILAAAKSAHAGPLDPPAGPVAGTYKTLTEVEPRIAINAVNTPGGANSLFRITQPGSYYLTGNITGVIGKHGIEIAASGVTIDLMGFDLQGVPGMGNFKGVIVTVSNLTDIAVVNGSIRNWDGGGVDLGSFVSHNGRVENVRASGNSDVGILVGQSSQVTNCTASLNKGTGILASLGGSTILNCTSYQNANYGIQVSSDSTVLNCTASTNTVHGINTGSGCTISNCTASNNTGNGIAAGGGCTITNCASMSNTQLGISVETGSTVADCTVRSNVLDGIRCNSSCIVRNNTCASNGNGGDGANIHATGNDNRIEGNNCILADRGIDVDAAGNIIVRNTCSGNTVNWDIAANNVVGPILDRTAPASAAISGNSAPDSTGSTHPNANFTY
ncbi:MAG: right-handed parallel beta-helix repeat-containing protein [Phycisphaeraceae bacterium]|nr:right-handed parallel beta-helix repeat-containing protein [Phycisphaeraceae bacterium]